MAERLAYLEAVVGADITQFRKSMRDVRSDVGILSDTIGGISGAARTMTFAFTAPMVALGTYAVEAASKFDASLRNINSILGLSEAEFQSLHNEVFAFARTTRDGVVPATEALYEVFSAGIVDQERAMAVWETSVRVAEAGVADLSSTTNAITATMSAFGLETSEATRVGNVWSRMVQLGVGSLDDFLSNSQKVLPLSDALGISLEDMGATLAFLSQGGGGAAKAETAYAMMLSNLLKPTQALEDAFKSLGVSSGDELLSKFGSVAGAVQALRGEVDKTTFNKMFSKTGLEAALRLANNVDAAADATKAFNESLDTATMDAWEQQAKSFAFQWDLLKAAVGAVAIVLGEAIMPLITPMIAGFTSFMQTLADTNPELLQLGVIFTGVIAAAAPLVWLLTSMLTPFGLIAGAVTTLSAAFATNFGGIRDTVVNAVSDIVGGLEPVKDAFNTFLEVLFPKIEDIPNADTPINVDIGERITVTEPKSLWQIYTDSGYADKFSWTEFMREAKEGGWGGGIVNIGDEITITGGAELGAGVGSDFAMSFEEKMRDTFGSAAGSMIVPETEPKLTIFDRLGDAVGAAWPKLKVALDGMWQNFVGWVSSTAIPAIDAAGGDILNAIAGWFDTSSSNFEGDGLLYDSITGVMTTDVGAAAAQAASTFESAFPELTGGLRSLFTNLGNWIIAEGIPTLSRSIGFLAGRLASLIGDALSGAWSSLTTGGGANAAANVVQTSLISPLQEGIAEGVGQTNSPIEGFFDNLGAMLLLAAGAWVLAPSIVSAIAMPIATGLASALWSALASSQLGVAVSGLVKVFGLGLGAAFASLSIIGIGALIVAALLSNEDIQAGLEGWSNLFHDLQVIFDQFIYYIQVGFADFQRDFENTVADIQLKFAVGKLLINSGDAAANEEKAQAELVLMTNDIMQKLEDGLAAYMAGSPVNLDIPGLVFHLGADAPDPVVSQELLDSITDPLMLGAALRKALGSGDTAAIQVLMPVQIALTASQNPLASTESVIAQLMAATGLDADNVAANMKQYYMSNPVMIDSIDAALKNVKLTVADTTTTDTSALTGEDSDWLIKSMGGAGTGNIEVPVDVMPMVENTDTAIQGWADTVAMGLPTAVTTAITENAGNMDAAAVSMTQPFVDSFTTAFSPDGTVTSVWATFLTGFVTDVTLLETTVTEKMPIIRDAAVAAATNIATSMLLAGLGIAAVSASLSALVAASPYIVDVQVNGVEGLPTGTPSITPDGAHAGGLDNVPFDNYLAQLHEGEMVLNKEDAAQYRSGIALPTRAPEMSIDNSSPTFIINGVNDFDAFLREAKRRGYHLEQYRR